MHESDNPDQIKKTFDDKIRTYVSANSGDAYSHLRIQPSLFSQVQITFTCIKLLYPSIRVRAAPPVSVRVRNMVSVSCSFTILCFDYLLITPCKHANMIWTCGNSRGRQGHAHHRICIAITKIQSILSKQNVLKKSHDFLSDAQNAMSIWRNFLSDI